MISPERTQSWTLTYEARPWTTNRERSGGKGGVGGHSGRAQLTREWRKAFADLALVHRVPPLRWASIEVLQVCRNNALPDIGACMPAVKAAIDGLVDARVLSDDTGEFLHHIGFIPPKNQGYDALVLQVTGPVCTPQERDEREAVHVRKLMKSMKVPQ